MVWLTWLSSHLMHCEFKTFEAASLKEAVDWAKQ
jgi:hypothetical protein